MVIAGTTMICMTMNHHQVDSIIVILHVTNHPLIDMAVEADILMIRRQ
jgi:hypothetical protein